MLMFIMVITVVMKKKVRPEDDTMKKVFLFYQKIGPFTPRKFSPLETICMNWQPVFWEKNKETKYFTLSSA